MSEDDNNNKGGRSLGGGSAEPMPSSWGQSNSAPRVGRIGDWNNSGSSSSRDNSGSRMRSLRDIISSEGPPRPPPSFGGRGEGQDDSDEEGGPEGGENWFAGGERSGISVQNPGRQGESGVPGGNVVRDLLRRAAERGPPPEQRARSTVFSGGGHTLGSDEMESSFVPDPDAADNDAEPTIRHLIFWRDGFTVEDGELMRYDDPNNEAVLAEIHSGRAPPSILNVQPGEPVELRVQKRTTEDYVPPKRGAFHGSGNRLGAPVPEVSGSAASASMPGSFPAAGSSSSESASSATRSSISTVFAVDQSKPTTSVQVRLADGTRLVARMNLTHTVLDLRNFINASRPENLTRPYTIATTFPNRVLEDNTATIEGAGLKNSVVVQKWDDL
ncbi:protein phosphatase regulator [Marasmius crinis-equi]|uniref:Protein phosphatase regulator n=1 Tax=Marasmius crinis-equi TaxID=585013 RepID=A0ABR3FFV5_9AGAR